MTKVLYIVRGLPGSGKTTLAHRLVKWRECVFEADDYFYDDYDRYRFDHTKLKDAHAECFARVHKHLSGETRDAAVANTFSQRWEMQPYIAIAKLFGWQVFIVWPSTAWAWDVGECAEKCVHGVPLEIIRRMSKRWEDHDVSWEL